MTALLCAALYSGVHQDEARNPAAESSRCRHHPDPRLGVDAVVFSWPANQRPDREQQVVAVKSALQSQGLQDHLAILVAHDDTAHHHVHVIACRVAETGRTNAMGRSGVKLSAWAEKYEREHGGIVIPTRVERSRQRAEFRTKVDKLMQDFSPPADLSPTAQARERAGARKAAVTKLRETGQHPLHPRQRPRVPGRAPFSLAERHAWRACLATQDGTNPKAELAERVALRAKLDAERAERKAAQARERKQVQSPDVGWGR